VVLSSIPMYLKAVMLSLLILMVTGAIHYNEMIIELGFSATYLVLIAYSVYSQAEAPVALVLVLLVLITRDSFHVSGRRSTSGVGYLVSLYLPLYILAVAALACSLLLRDTLPRIGSAPVALAAILAVLVLSRFLARESVGKAQRI
jgi:hypothetical protein